MLVKLYMFGLVVILCRMLKVLSGMNLMFVCFRLLYRVLLYLVDSVVVVVVLGLWNCGVMFMFGRFGMSMYWVLVCFRVFISVIWLVIVVLMMFCICVCEVLLVVVCVVVNRLLVLFYMVYRVLVLVFLLFVVR